jgi:hypothetical protein
MNNPDFQSWQRDFDRWKATMNPQTDVQEFDQERFVLLIRLIGATVELIAATRTEIKKNPFPMQTRRAVADGLRQLGACAYQLAAELEDKKCN